ncbi:RNA polymerase ii-associated protein [Anaeramoeba flamelloides]|uniref:RNA polymerase II-associated protein 3 n=1 Tax=Anaeramoeba flamelloides TaxID=1746091 RepID=A0AAV7YCC8_9EUKA|nr:RNA polymerase ii-associated protein [Anaeramoeba flamelloides]
MTSNSFARFEKWLDLMKKKDLEATQKKKNQRTNIPPIRKNNDKFNLKKQTNTTKTEKKQKIENFTVPTVEEILSTSSEEEITVKKEPEKKKRISSYDYDGWDKLIYEEKKKKQLIDEALEHKAKGNKCYGSKKWKEAITHYTKAISIYDGDHIFYSNRAACYLKIKMYKSAEEDCTRALQIDPKFIKAWFRRGLARKNLKNYRFAIKDFKKVLKLQPENQASVKEILAINKQIKQENPLNTSQKTNSSKQTKAKAKPNTQRNAKTNNSNSKKIENERKQLEKIQEQLLGLNVTPLKNIKQKQVNKPQIQVIDKNENEDEKLKQNKKKKEKPPSLKTENKIINEKENKKVTTNKKTEQNYNNTKKNTNDQQTTANNTTTPNTKKTKTTPNNKTDKENPKKQQTSKVAQLKSIEVSIPSTSPKTFFEFEKIWRQFSQIQNEDTKLDSKNKYLEIINPQLLPKIFQNSFSVEYFVEILQILQYRLKINKSPNESMKSNINKILYYISQIPRFSMAFMFLSRKEKQILTEIIGKTNVQKNQLYLKVRKLYKM